jgi:hypothetical protein
VNFAYIVRVDFLLTLGSLKDFLIGITTKRISKMSEKRLLKKLVVAQKQPVVTITRWHNSSRQMSIVQSSDDLSDGSKHLAPPVSV